MLFIYTGIAKDGSQTGGDIESATYDTAVLELQKRQIVILSLSEKKVAGDHSISLGKFKVKTGAFFTKKVKQKDVVVFSRQVATLFEAGVSALKAFLLLASENDNKVLAQHLTEVADDIQAGVSMSDAMTKHPGLFSTFYINMVKAGEESGKLNETFLYLADYLDRDYELTQKTRKALTYPAFVITTFIIIMVVMFTFVIPKMAALFADQGTELPQVTQIILNISTFLTTTGPYLLPLIIAGGWFFSRYIKTPAGRWQLDTLKTKTPVFKNLYQKIFLARLSDNMNTMLASGVSIVRAIEITADVVDNEVYRALLLRASQKVQAGRAFSEALYDEKDIPNILIQMTKIGEETGEMGYILKNLATFYKREVDTAIDSVIGLIEPAMIVGLGLAVGVLVSSVLLPMYSLSDSIS